MTLSSLEVVGFQKQTALGSGIDPVFLEAVTPGTFRASEEYEQLIDNGRRGVDAMDFRALQGVAITNITWDGLIRHGDNTQKSLIGYLLANLLGTGSLASATQIAVTGNYDHRLILGTTKEYFTIEHKALASSSDRRFVDCRVTEITIQFNRGEDFVTYTVTLQGKETTLVTVQSLTDNLLDPHRGWEGVAVVNAANTRLLSGEWTLRRSATPFYSAANSQDFQDLYLGPLEVTCSLILDYSAVTDIALLRAKTQGELSIFFAIGTLVGGVVQDDDNVIRKFGIGGKKFDFGDGPAELDNSNENIRLALSARGLYDTTAGVWTSDSGTNTATANQNSPVEIQIIQPEADDYDTA